MTTPIEISNHELCVDCGNCCKAFTLGKLPEDVLKTPESDDRTVTWLRDEISEIDHKEIVGVLNPVTVKAFPRDEYYTCRLVGEDGKCTDYENRPHTCKMYPGNYRGDDLLVDWDGRNPYVECPLLDKILDEEYLLRNKIEHKVGDKSYDGYLKKADPFVDEELRSLCQ